VQNKLDWVAYKWDVESSNLTATPVIAKTKKFLDLKVQRLTERFNFLAQKLKNTDQNPNVKGLMTRIDRLKAELSEFKGYQEFIAKNTAVTVFETFVKMKQKHLAEKKEWLTKRLSQVKKEDSPYRIVKVQKKLAKVNKRIQLITSQKPIEILSVYIDNQSAELNKRLTWEKKHLGKGGNNENNSAVQMAKEFLQASIPKFEAKLEKIYWKSQKVQWRLKSKGDKLNRRKLVKLNQKLKNLLGNVKMLKFMVAKMRHVLNFVDTHTPEEVLKKFIEMKKWKLGKMQDWLEQTIATGDSKSKKIQKMMRKLDCVQKRLAVVETVAPEQQMRKFIRRKSKMSKNMKKMMRVMKWKFARWGQMKNMEPQVQIPTTNVQRRAEAQGEVKKPVFFRLHQKSQFVGSKNPQGPPPMENDRHTTMSSPHKEHKPHGRKSHGKRHGRPSRHHGGRHHKFFSTIKAFFKGGPPQGRGQQNGPPPPQFLRFHHDIRDWHHRQHRKLIGMIIAVSIAVLLLLFVAVLLCCFYKRTSRQLLKRINVLIGGENATIYAQHGYKLLIKPKCFTLYLAKTDFTLISNNNMQDYQAIARAQPQVVDFRRVVQVAQPQTQPQFDMRTRTNTNLTHPDPEYYQYTKPNDSQTELNPQPNGQQNVVSQQCNLPVGPPPAHHYPQHPPQNYYNYMVPAERAMYGMPQRVPLYTQSGAPVLLDNREQEVPKQK
jgi:hypothetical protein